jgi:hypothetical protein
MAMRVTNEVFSNMISSCYLDTNLNYTISHRVARYLERQGIMERDEENSYLQLDGIDDDSMQQLMGCSISHRIAVGP